MALGMYNEDFYAATRTYPVGDSDYWTTAKPLDLTPTIRTDITREEHELLLAIREYNRATDVNNEAEDVLEKAREDANSTRIATSDARFELDEAMRAVKHGYAY